MTEPNENTALYAIKELSQAYNGRTVLNID